VRANSKGYSNGNFTIYPPCATNTAPNDAQPSPTDAKNCLTSARTSGTASAALHVEILRFPLLVLFAVAWFFWPTEPVPNWRPLPVYTLPRCFAGVKDNGRHRRHRRCPPCACGCVGQRLTAAVTKSACACLSVQRQYDVHRRRVSAVAQPFGHMDARHPACKPKPFTWASRVVHALFAGGRKWSKLELPRRRRSNSFWYDCNSDRPDHLLHRRQLVQRSERRQHCIAL
jgi:hypothetical protein